jgi:hypothetical protein
MVGGCAEKFWDLLSQRTLNLMTLKSTLEEANGLLRHVGYLLARQVNGIAVNGNVRDRR